MTPDPQPTEQEQGECVAVHRSGHVMDIDRMRLVRIPPGLRDRPIGVRIALKDPSRVYRVEAYPKVVEALKRARELLYQWMDAPETGSFNVQQHAITPINTALAAVHPERAET